MTSLVLSPSFDFSSKRGHNLRLPFRTESLFSGVQVDAMINHCNFFCCGVQFNYIGWHYYPLTKVPILPFSTIDIKILVDSYNRNFVPTCIIIIIIFYLKEHWEVLRGEKETKDYFSKEKFLIQNLRLRDNWTHTTGNSVKALARSNTCSVQHIITLLPVSETVRLRGNKSHTKI